jgi:hypothetical protein
MQLGKESSWLQLAQRLNVATSDLITKQPKALTPVHAECMRCSGIEMQLCIGGSTPAVLPGRGCLRGVHFDIGEFVDF